MRFVEAAFLVWIAMVVAGCRARSTPAPVGELPVEVSGCGVVLVDGTCELDASRALRVWAPASPVEVLADGHAVAVVATQVGKGTRVSFDVPLGARSVELRCARDGAPARATLAIGDVPAASLLGELAAAQKSGRHADVVVDEATLAALPPRVAARALDLVGRSKLATGKASDARETLARAQQLHRASGALSPDVHDDFAIAYAEIFVLGELESARARLAAARTRGRSYAHGLAEQPYYEGLLASEAGDYRAALAAFDEADQRSERIGRTDHSAAIERSRVLVLAEIGRFDEARARLARTRSALASDAPACQRAHVLTNAGWIALRAAEHAAGRDEPTRDTAAESEASSALDEAIALYERACPSAAYVENARTNLARVALLRGDAAALATLLARPRDGAGDPRNALWWADVAARAALGSGDAKTALREAERERALAESAGLADAVWRATVAEAEALEALKKPARAEEAYARAEAQLDRHSLQVPLALGRDAFVADRSRSARLYVDLLLRRGNARAAFEVARRARTRALSTLRWTARAASLDAPTRARWDEAIAAYRRERSTLDAEIAGDWKLSVGALGRAREARAARLLAVDGALDRAAAIIVDGATRTSVAPPGPGEVVLLAHPLRDGYALFAADETTTTAFRVATWPEPAALLGPFEATLARATRVRVLASGPLKRLDVHALAFRGTPLGHARTVVYGVDVPGLLAGAYAARGGAVVVADSQGNLDAARAEGDAVAARAAALLGMPSTLLGEGVQRDDVVRALGDASLLHVAGHGRFATSGWGSALELSAGTALTVPDVLALPGVPRLVVLSGCETARTNEAVSVQSLGLSEAFVLAGAEVVVAASRPVDDVATRALMTALYSSDAVLADLPAALARAQRMMAEREPSGDWAAFRSVVP